MTATLEPHQEAPPLWQLYGRALGKSLPGLGHRAGARVSPGQIPALEALRYGAAGDPAEVEAYARLCGFESGLNYPVTWPHILAFPLHLRLLTDRAFPLPLLGLVHLRNRIVQQRNLHRGEYLDLRCDLANATTTARGLEFDLCTQAINAGQTVWEETSTMLFRQNQNRGQVRQNQNQNKDQDQIQGQRQNQGQRPAGALPRYRFTRDLQVPESIGRRYSRVSGDLNPIHLHALSARLFGFPRAIAHGMWSKAQCLAILQRQAAWRPGPVDIAVAFKTPLLLPGKATLNWEATAPGPATSMDFQLLNGKATAPHLSGQVRWL